MTRTTRTSKENQNYFAVRQELKGLYYQGCFRKLSFILWYCQVLCCRNLCYTGLKRQTVLERHLKFGYDKPGAWILRVPPLGTSLILLPIWVKGFFWSLLEMFNSRSTLLNPRNLSHELHLIFTSSCVFIMIKQDIYKYNATPFLHDITFLSCLIAIINVMTMITPDDEISYSNDDNINPCKQGRI